MRTRQEIAENGGPVNDDEWEVVTGMSRDVLYTYNKAEGGVQTPSVSTTDGTDESREGGN